MTFELKPIGHIKTPYSDTISCPNNIQANGPICGLMLDKAYQKGLTGLEVGQWILVLYWFENVDRDLIQQPLADGTLIGTFALRSPHRPNPVVAAVVPIEKISQGCITVKGLDCLNGTALIDIKPAILRET
ncbi:Conserved hypothetical protein [Shewanella piezotolerans WP3]|uniref:TsaA-like domain-containing protein n=1 Tax=Shewanella piezotolerans (strain WP3 / JCM 13877) TaxID=225849 RepID=B8CTM3_SHEPW|nr:SAM-dependent methyltransferase [Shewanella piezotolerans]ACJ31267.1 Conserved hypothetical protein [Shewanella piezotolerans WP3]